MGLEGVDMVGDGTGAGCGMGSGVSQRRSGLAGGRVEYYKLLVDPGRSFLVSVSARSP